MRLSEPPPFLAGRGAHHFAASNRGSSTASLRTQSLMRPVPYYSESCLFSFQRSSKFKIINRRGLCGSFPRRVYGHYIVAESRYKPGGLVAELRFDENQSADRLFHLVGRLDHGFGGESV